MKRFAFAMFMLAAVLAFSFMAPQSARAEDATHGANGLVRKPCPASMSCPVQPGESVVGAVVSIGDSVDHNCRVNSAPSGVKVTDGVINFWAAEAASHPMCSFVSTAPPSQAGHDTVNGLPRRECPAGNPCVAREGEAAIGFEVSYKGTVQQSCYVPRAPEGLTVTDGVLNPWHAEVSTARQCDFGFTTSAPAPSAGSGTISGSVPRTHYGLVVFGGGTTEQLITAARCGTNSAIFWSLQNGRWVAFVDGAPSAVNSDWHSRYPSGIPAGTPLVARCL